MKSAEAWAVGFVELITGLVNFEPWLVLTGMIDMFFATVGFALGVFVLVPLLEFAVVLELAILSIGWIISNIFGAIPVLAGPLLGALAAAVVPGVAGVTGLAGLAAVPAVGAAAGAPAALVGSVAPVSGGVVSPQARLVSAVEPAPASTSVSVLASDRGAGALGFVGTAGKESVGQPAGLTVLADEFGDGAPVPMLPGSWGPDLVGVAGDGGPGQHGWRAPAAAAPPLDQVRRAITEHLLGAARRRAFRVWLDARRNALVVLAPGYEHPGDPRQPDNTRRH